MRQKREIVLPSFKISFKSSLNLQDPSLYETMCHFAKIARKTHKLKLGAFHPRKTHHLETKTAQRGRERGAL